MYNFELSNSTKIVFGSGWHSQIGKTVSCFGSRVLLVMGESSVKKTGIYDEVVEILRNENIVINELSGIKTNPSVDLVREGVSICQQNKVDVLLAIGGGSVIDSAKAISVSSFYNGDCWDIIQNKVTIKEALPIIVLSTISGTGTEMNNSCVLSNSELKIKKGYSNELLRPKVSFLDPELTFSVTPFNTACGVADALSHILDTTYMVNGKNMPMLQDIMESICRTLVKYGPIAVKNGNDYEARANIMWAASWGLNGFLKSGIKQLAACHAIEHELSAKFNISHGFGMALVMPNYYEYVLNNDNSYLFESFAKNVFGVDSSLPKDVAAKKMIDCLRSFLYKELMLPSTLDIECVSDKEIMDMADRICWGKDLPGLVSLNVADVVTIIKKIIRKK